MNGKSKGKRSRRRKMLARLMDLPPERRTEVVKNTCANLRAKETRKWSWEFSGNPHSSGGAAGFHKRKGVKFTRGVPTN